MFLSIIKYRIPCGSIGLQTGAWPLHVPSLRQVRASGPNRFSWPGAHVYSATSPTAVLGASTMVPGFFDGWPHPENSHTELKQVCTCTRRQ